MDNLLSFFAKNEEVLVSTLRSQGKVGKNAQAKACTNYLQTLSEEDMLTLAIEMGFNPNSVEETVVEDSLVTPTGVEVLTFTTESGVKVPYAMLPIVKITSERFKCQYGDSIVEVYKGDQVAGLAYDELKPVIGQLVAVKLGAGYFKRDDAGKYTSSILASADPVCKKYIAYAEQTKTTEGALARQLVKRDETGTLTVKQARTFLRSKKESSTQVNYEKIMSETKVISFADFLNSED